MPAFLVVVQFLNSTTTHFPALSFPVLPQSRFSRTLKGMEVHFAPDLPS
jgi:hypothetical protein